MAVVLSHDDADSASLFYPSLFCGEVEELYPYVQQVERATNTL